ncbi:MAG: hypothetical protein LBQ87_07875 [Candidatus Fibromonas sp.]|jgi:chromate transport protein ChrA|nr:hypothetical protein [Candidatus Fibromonas sp.]
MIFDLDKKHIFKSSFYSNLAQTAIHFRFEKEDTFILAFVLAIVTFAISYLIVWFLTLIYSQFNKEKQLKTHICAFYFTIIALLANNIISLAGALADYLFKMDLMFEVFIFPLMLSIGTTPFFVIMLLMWLLIKAFQYLRNSRLKKQQEQ